MKKDEAKEAMGLIVSMAEAGFRVSIERGPFDEWTVYVFDAEEERMIGDDEKPWCDHVHTHLLLDGLRQVQKAAVERTRIR